MMSKKVKVISISVLAALFLVAGVTAGLFGTGVLSFKDKSVPLAASGKNAAKTKEGDTPAEISGMKAFFLVPGMDFIIGDAPSKDTVSAEIDQIFEKLKEYGFDTIITDLSMDGSVIYKSENYKDKGTDFLKLLLGKAKENDIKLYASFNFYGNAQKKGKLSSGLSDAYLKTAKEELSALSENYKLDGILLSGFNVADTPENYNEFRINGTSLSYNEWLTERNTFFITQASAAISSGNSKMAKGLITDPVWANLFENETGSDTNSEFRSLYDGHADTKGLLEAGLFDFIMVKAYGSTRDENAPFETVVKWWSNLSEVSGIPFCVMHAADKACSSEPGWNGADQLARQLSIAVKQPGYKGSAYFGYSKLIENPGGSTDALLGVYSKEYNDEQLFSDIIVTSPEKTSFTTNELRVKFMGKFDPHFPVKINENEITPTSEGEFLEWFDLKPGDNTFVLSHKGVDVTYKIKREMTVIKSVSPDSDITLPGGMEITVSAVAYKGSSVTAKLNGKSINLSESSQPEDFDADSNYTVFRGSFNLPGGTSNVQNLGAVKFTGTFEGYTQSVNGGSVSVDKIYVSSLPDDFSYDPPASVGITGAEPPWVDIGAYGNPSNKILEITAGYANVFRPQNTYTSAEGNMYSLPYGTLDFVIGQYPSGNPEFYILNSGKRVRAKDARVVSGVTIGNNALAVSEVRNAGKYTEIVIKQHWKAPFNIAFPGIPYGTGFVFNPSCGITNLSLNSFAPGQVAIEFDYAVDAAGFDNSLFDTSPLFTGGVWQTYRENGINKCRLLLNLRKTGGYYGANAYYDMAGNLVLSFKHPAGSLSGVRVAISPGHGGKITDSGARVYDPGALINAGSTIYYEEVANWAISQKLKSALESQGAIVKVLNTQGEYFSLEDRVNAAQSFNPDIVIAVHQNSDAKIPTSNSGVEAYYNTPFSYPLAKAVADSVGNYYHSTMYPGSGGKNRGAKYYDYRETCQKQYASILLECGFITNLTEAPKLYDGNYQDGMAWAIVDGIKNYLNR